MHILLTRFYEAHLASLAALGEQFSTRTVLEKMSSKTLAKEPHSSPSSASEEIHGGYTQTQSHTHTHIPRYLDGGRNIYLELTHAHKHTRTRAHGESQRSDEIDEKRIHSEPGGLDKY